MPEEQITEIDLLQALVSSQTNLSEQNSLVIEMLSTLLPQPQSEEESSEPSLKELMMLMLEQQELIIQTLQGKTSKEPTDSIESLSSKEEKNKELKDE